MQILRIRDLEFSDLSFGFSDFVIQWRELVRGFNRTIVLPRKLTRAEAPISSAMPQVTVQYEAVVPDVSQGHHHSDIQDTTTTTTATATPPPPATTTTTSTNTSTAMTATTTTTPPPAAAVAAAAATLLVSHCFSCYY